MFAVAPEITEVYIVPLFIFACVCLCAGGGGAGDNQAGGERGPRLLGKTPPPSLRAAAGGSGPQPGQGQTHPKASQLQRYDPGGPRSANTEAHHGHHIYKCHR